MTCTIWVWLQYSSATFRNPFLAAKLLSRFHALKKSHSTVSHKTTIPLSILALDEKHFAAEQPCNLNTFVSKANDMVSCLAVLIIAPHDTKTSLVYIVHKVHLCRNNIH